MVWGFLRRATGLIIVLVTLVTLAAAGGMGWYGGQVVGTAAQGTGSAVSAVNDNLGLTLRSLRLARESVTAVSQTLDTVSITAADAARTITETQPLLNEVSTIATQEVPDSLDTVQDTLPNVAEVAGTIDDTLFALSQFGVRQDFFGLGTLDFDLGIDYDPTQRFDESIEQLGTSLEGLPERLRDLETELENTEQNLSAVGGNVGRLSEDIAAVNEVLADVPAQLDAYERQITQVQDDLRGIRGMVNQQTANARTVVWVAAGWLALTQLAPLAIGLMLLFGRRETEPDPAVNANAESAADSPTKD